LLLSFHPDWTTFIAQEWGPHKITVNGSHIIIIVDDLPECTPAYCPGLIMTPLGKFSPLPLVVHL
jgi:hypothetical protein